MYETLLEEFGSELEVKETTLDYNFRGLYKDGFILIEKVQSITEKCCVLAEEIGHYFTSAGNIIDLRDLSNRKQERRAREWAYNKLISIHRLVGAKLAGCENKYEIADHLGVTVEFLEDCITHYFQKYGKSIKYKQWVIMFEPLDVVEY